MVSVLTHLCVTFAVLLAPPQDQKKETGIGVLRQPGDPVAEPLKKPLPDAVKRRVQAQSWFMAGKVEQREGRAAQAYDAFRKALDLDPNAVTIYRELIPLAFQLNKTAEAARLARKAIELDPDDYEILQQLAMLSAASNRVAQAIDYTEQALKSKRLKEASLEYVILTRDLVRLCAASRRLDRAAEGCDVLFDALKDPAKYGLNARAQRVLAQQTDLIGNIFASAGQPDKAIAVFVEQDRVRGGRAGSQNLNLARLYFATKDYENAEKQILTFFDTRPGGVEAYRLYSQILDADGRGDEVLDNLEKISEQDGRNATLQFYLADLYVEAKRLDDAEAVIRRAMRISGNPAGYLGLVEIYRQQNAPEKLFNALVRASSQGIDAGPLIGRIASSGDIAVEVLKLGQQRLDENPEGMDYQLSYVLGRIAAAAEKTEPAIAFLRSALQLGTADKIPEVSLDLGTQLLFSDEYAEAAQVFENALRTPPKSEQERRRVVFLLYRLAQAREFGDETDLAIKALRRAQQMPEGDLPLLHYQEGWTYYHAGQIDKAEAKLQVVLQQYSTDPDTTMRTRMLLASVHSQQRNFATAIREFESILNDYADNAATVRSARMTLSSLYISKGDQLKAEQILEDVLKDNPEDPGVNNDLGYLYADQGKNLDKAEAMIRKAVAASPDNAAYLDSLGWVLFRQEKFEEAVEILKKAVALPDGRDSTILEHLGDNYEKLGKTDDAIKQWKRALDVETGAAYPDESVTERLKKKLDEARGADDNK